MHRWYYSDAVETCLLKCSRVHLQCLEEKLKKKNYLTILIEI